MLGTGGAIWEKWHGKTITLALCVNAFFSHSIIIRWGYTYNTRYTYNTGHAYSTVYTYNTVYDYNTEYSSKMKYTRTRECIYNMVYTYNAGYTYIRGIYNAGYTYNVSFFSQNFSTSSNRKLVRISHEIITGT